MKKRRIVIGSGVAVLILIAVGGLAAYRMMQGPEKLSGRVEAIPRAIASPEPMRAGQADWLCWRGVNSDGKSAVTGIRTDWSGGLKKLWEVNYLCQGSRTAAWSAPVVRGNRLVVPGRDAQNDLVFCLDSETGGLIWVKSYKAPIRLPMHGPGARATPYIDDDRVYTFGYHGDLACRRLADGELLWKHNVADAGGEMPMWGHSSSPLVWENKVFVQGGGQGLVLAYDKLTGEVLWKALRGKAGYAAITPMRESDATKLLVFHGTGLACLDPADGGVSWQVPWKTNYDVHATTPVVAGQAVFMTSGYSTGGQALRISDGKAQPLWRNKAIASQHTDPAIIDGFIYGYSGQSEQNRGDLKCVDLQTGTQKWSTGEAGWGTLVQVDGYLLCQDIKGDLFLVKPNPSAFTKVTEMQAALGEVTNPVWTVPTVANGRLYLRHMQRLVCYDLLAE